MYELRYPDGTHYGYATFAGDFARSRVDQLGQGATLIDDGTGRVIYVASHPTRCPIDLPAGPCIRTYRHEGDCQPPRWFPAGFARSTEGTP